MENRIRRRISRTGVDVSTPISTQIHSGISETSTPDSSDITGTRISIVISSTSTAPPDEDFRSPGIGNKRKSASPNIRKSDKLDASIDGKFTNISVAPPIFTELFRDKLSNSSRRDIYARVGVHLKTCPVNPVTPKFVDRGFSTIDALNKGARIWIPAIRVRSSTDVSHWSTLNLAVVESTVVVYSVIAKSYYNYKLILKFGGEIFNLSVKILKGVDHLWNQLMLVQKL